MNGYRSNQTIFYFKTKNFIFRQILCPDYKIMKLKFERNILEFYINTKSFTKFEKNFKPSTKMTSLSLISVHFIGYQPGVIILNDGF